MSHQERFRLGAVRVAPALGLLEVEGRSVHLEPRVMNLLYELARRPGSVLSREELLDAVWGEAFVCEEVLTQAISALRRALGDDSRDPRFVATIPKRGYRLLVEPRPDADPGAVGDIGAARRPLSASGKRWIGAAAIVATCVAAGLLLGLRESSSAGEAQPLLALPLTASPGRESQPALSPDGDRVAFVSSPRTGASDLYVERLGEAGARRLTRDAALEGRPAWSPDGRWLAFARLEQGSCSLRLIDLDGEVERSIGECAGGHLAELSWAADGSALVLTEPATPAGMQRLSVLDLASGERRRLTTPGEAGLGDRFPAVSPDGAEVAFIRTGLLGASDVWVVGFERGEARPVTRERVPMSGVTWSDDGARLVYAADRGGGFRLWTVDRRGGESSWLALAEGQALRPSLRAGRLVFERPRFHSEIWRTGGSGPSPLLPSTRWDEQPAVSPDGSRLVFVSDRSGASELWLVGRDGAGLGQLTRLGAQRIAGVRWAPDGREVALSAWRGGQADLFLVDAETGVAREMTRTPDNEIAPAWSERGDELFFLSDRGAWGVWRLGTDGVPRRVRQVRASAVWAEPGGRGLLISRFDRDGIWRLPLSGGDLELVEPGLARGDFANWGLSGGGLFLLERRPEGPPLVRLRAGTEWRALGVAAAGPEDLGLAVTADGEAFFARSDRGESDLLWVPRL